MQMNLKIIAGCCLLANVAFCAVDALPERIISGYYGWNVLRKGDYERNAHMADVVHICHKVNQGFERSYYGRVAVLCAIF